jgi:hypothetical protein
MPSVDSLRERTDPLPGRHQNLRNRGTHDAAASFSQSPDSGLVLQRLRNDPSLRFTENGRSLLRVLHLGVAAVRDCRQPLEAVPPHSLYPTAELARAAAAGWLELAESLRERTEVSAGHFAQLNAPAQAGQAVAIERPEA